MYFRLHVVSDKTAEQGISDEMEQHMVIEDSVARHIIQQKVRVHTRNWQESWEILCLLRKDTKGNNLI